MVWRLTKVLSVCFFLGVERSPFTASEAEPWNLRSGDPPATSQNRERFGENHWQRVY